MGDLIPLRKRLWPFRKRPKAPKTWTRPEDYGRVLSTAQWGGPGARRGGRLVRLWRAIRWWLALIVLAALWVLYRNAIAFDPPAFLERQPVAIDGTLRCPRRVVLRRHKRQSLLRCHARFTGLVQSFTCQKRHIGSSRKNKIFFPRRATILCRRRGVNSGLRAFDIPWLRQILAM